MKEYHELIKRNLEFDNYRTLKEAVFAALKKSIVLGEISAGQRINELANFPLH